MRLLGTRDQERPDRVVDPDASVHCHIEHCRLLESGSVPLLAD
jgi:hypothetical protein